MYSCCSNVRFNIFISDSVLSNSNHFESSFGFDSYSKYVKFVILEPNNEKIAICSTFFSQCAMTAWIIANSNIPVV